jgi:hypothetical protein
MFDNNEFTLTKDATSHKLLSLSSPLIFGPLGLPHCLHFLRDIRNICFVLDISEEGD